MAAAEGHVPAPSHGLHNATTQPARVRRGSTGLKVVDNSQVCANSLEFYASTRVSIVLNRSQTLPEE